MLAVLAGGGSGHSVRPFSDKVLRALPGRNDGEILEEIAAP